MPTLLTTAMGRSMASSVPLVTYRSPMSVPFEATAAQLHQVAAVALLNHLRPPFIILSNYNLFNEKE